MFRPASLLSTCLAAAVEGAQKDTLLPEWCDDFEAVVKPSVMGIFEDGISYVSLYITQHEVFHRST